MRVAFLAATILLTPFAARAETTFQTARYTCERGVEVPVTYVDAEDLSLAVLNVEGEQITLEAERSASGARYGWPSDGSHYVWWTSDTGAVLIWHEGETGEEVTLHAECVRN